LIILLAAEMTVVYPAHILIDHVGIFDHYQDHGSNQIPADESEDDLCQFCFNMAGMVHAETLTIQPTVDESENLSFFFQNFQTETDLVVQTRAPPFDF
jgi:hypothetical protein